MNNNKKSIITTILCGIKTAPLNTYKFSNRRGFRVKPTTTGLKDRTTEYVQKVFVEVNDNYEE